MVAYVNFIRVNNCVYLSISFLGCALLLSYIRVHRCVYVSSGSVGLHVLRVTFSLLDMRLSLGLSERQQTDGMRYFVATWVNCASPAYFNSKLLFLLYTLLAFHYVPAPLSAHPFSESAFCLLILLFRLHSIFSALISFYVQISILSVQIIIWSIAKCVSTSYTDPSILSSFISSSFSKPF